MAHQGHHQQIQGESWSKLMPTLHCIQPTTTKKNKQKTHSQDEMHKVKNKLNLIALTFESAAKLKYWNKIATTRNTIPTTIPNDSGLHNIKSNHFPI